MLAGFVVGDLTYMSECFGRLHELCRANDDEEQYAAFRGCCIYQTDKPVLWIRISPDELSVCVVTLDVCVYIFHLQDFVGTEGVVKKNSSLSVVKLDEKLEEVVTNVYFSPDSSTALVSTSHGTLLFLPRYNPQEFRKYETEGLSCANWGASKDLILLGMKDGTVKTVERENIDDPNKYELWINKPGNTAAANYEGMLICWSQFRCRVI